MIAIDDGGTVTYHRNINSTCTENLLMDKFSGWKFDINKPIEELEVGSRYHSSRASHNIENNPFSDFLCSKHSL